MSNDTVVSLAAPAQVCDPLTDLLPAGARRLIEATVTAELEEYLSSFGPVKLPDGRQRVVRNSHHLPERKILPGVGEVDVRVLLPHARACARRPQVRCPSRPALCGPHSIEAVDWLGCAAVLGIGFSNLARVGRVRGRLQRSALPDRVRPLWGSSRCAHGAAGASHDVRIGICALCSESLDGVSRSRSLSRWALTFRGVCASTVPQRGATSPTGATPQCRRIARAASASSGTGANRAEIDTS